MKEFMKTWTIVFIKLFGIFIIVCIFFGVIYWLDKFGVIGYSIGIWILIWVSAIVTCSDHPSKKK